MEDHFTSALAIVKQANTELSKQADFKQIEPSKVNLEIVQSEEEEKRHDGKRSVGRQVKSRTIQNSSSISSSDNKPQPTRQTRKDDVPMTTEIVINIDETQPKHRERSSSRLTMSANAQSQAQSAPTNELFAAPQVRGPTRKRTRYEAEAPVTDKVSPSPTRPISDEQEARIRNETKTVEQR